MQDKVKLSKKLSYYLRHHPEELGIKLNSNGFTNIEIKEFANRLNTTADRIKEIVREDEKQRFTISNNKIRANYGHSVDVGKSMYFNKATMNNSSLPRILYHGTKENKVNIILNEGLKPIKRKFVHLSFNKIWAEKVGNRRNGRTVILSIDTKKAEDLGVKFWKAGPTTVLSTRIPPKCISIIEH